MCVEEGREERKEGKVKERWRGRRREVKGRGKGVEGKKKGDHRRKCERKKSVGVRDDGRKEGKVRLRKGGEGRERMRKERRRAGML